MVSNFAKPILASSLPHSFRKIRLELARESEHPEGDAQFSYTLIAPLNSLSQIDHDTWRSYQEASRIIRQRPGKQVAAGHIIRDESGTWTFHYEEHGGEDEIGYRLSDERFTVGEYISILGEDGTHVYKVASVERL